MADDRKNPLLGAFRSTAPGAAPPSGTTASKPTEENKPTPETKTVPTTGTPAPAKADEKKPVEPAKSTTNPKATPTTGTAAPVKGDEKKTAEPAKPTADTKTVPTTGTPTPAKGDEKKPVEQGKTATDPKAAPTTGTAAPVKGDEKKTAEPAKPTADTKTVPTTGTPTPAKADEKKPTEQVKTATDPKTAPATGTSAPVKTDEPPKPAADSKTAPAIGTDPTAEPDVEIPKNFTLPIARAGQSELITTLKVAEIHPFEGHPFSVKDDKDMWDLVESVKQFGVLEPITVIPRKEGGYEMVSGHRRQRACQLAGIETMPVIVRNLDRDEATISMVDANLKRENISPMEKARAYSMKLDAMKRKAGRLSKTDILNGAKPMRADEQLAQQTGESRSNIQKITRLTKLEPELQQMVEEKKLPVHTAADISYLKKDEQKALADAIEKEGGTVPSGTQAAELKKESQAGKLTPEKIERTVAPTKREVDPPLKVTFNDDELRDYFPDKGTTVGTVKRTMFEALDLRKKALERQAKKEAEKNEPVKKPGIAR